MAVRDGVSLCFCLHLKHEWKRWSLSMALQKSSVRSLEMLEQTPQVETAFLISAAGFYILLEDSVLQTRVIGTDGKLPECPEGSSSSVF